MARAQTAEIPVHMDTVDLAGRVVIVSGGTTGIGRATAILLAQRGARVVIYGRHEKELNDALNDLGKTGGEFLGLTADNAYEDQIRKVFEETRNRFGDVDILINNAALPARNILQTSYEDALYVLRANIFGYMVCIREAVEMMRRKGEGHIVNIGSMSAQEREAEADVYVATKAAIEGISESYRKQLGKEGIRVSLIEPGSVGTSLSGGQESPEQQVEMQGRGENLKAEDIAAAILYVLTQPPRCNVLNVRIAPVKQAI